MRPYPARTVSDLVSRDRKRDRPVQLHEEASCPKASRVFVVFTDMVARRTDHAAITSRTWRGCCPAITRSSVGNSPLPRPRARHGRRRLFATFDGPAREIRARASDGRRRPHARLKARIGGSTSESARSTRARSPGPSAPASRPTPAQARCSSRRPCRNSSPDQESASKIEVKGIPGSWQLFAVARPRLAPRSRHGRRRPTIESEKSFGSHELPCEEASVPAAPVFGNVT